MRAEMRVAFIGVQSLVSRISCLSAIKSMKRLRAPVHQFSYIGGSSSSELGDKKANAWGVRTGPSKTRRAGRTYVRSGSVFDGQRSNGGI
jgi:hypothetical protein